MPLGNFRWCQGSFRMYSKLYRTTRGPKVAPLWVLDGVTKFWKISCFPTVRDIIGAIMKVNFTGVKSTAMKFTFPLSSRGDWEHIQILCRASAYHGSLTQKMNHLHELLYIGNVPSMFLWSVTWLHGHMTFRAEEPTLQVQVVFLVQSSKSWHHFRLPNT